MFLNIADYASYSRSRVVMSRAIDTAVSAASQEIDVTKSKTGLGDGFATNGVISVNTVYLDEVASDNMFYTMMTENCGLTRAQLSDKVLRVLITPTDAGIEYIVSKGASRATGTIANMSELEDVVNARILEFYSNADLVDKDVVYVNGNLKTNNFKRRPYYMVMIKDLQINGIRDVRTSTFVSFAGAKIERN